MASDTGRYRKLFVRIWRHPEFTKLRATDRLLSLYALTGPQQNRAGLGYFSVSTAAEDLGVPLAALRASLTRVCAAFSWEYDSDARVLYIPSWWTFNPRKTRMCWPGR